jgi:hypothetical protein
LLGGVSKLGGKLTGSVAKTAILNIDKALLRVSAELGVRMAGEGIEEGLQNVLEPVFRNIAFGESHRIEINADTWYQMLIGAITAGLLEGAPAVARNISNTRAGYAVQQAQKVDALITNALTLDPKTEAGKLAGRLADGSIHENQYNIGELLRAYLDAGGDTTFMYTPNLDTLAQSIQTRDGEIFVPDLPDVNAILTVPADVQLQSTIQSSIASNAQIHPESVQAALTQGMTTLTQIEARINADSGNVNHMGIDISASHNAYMDFSTQKGTIADTAKEAKLGTAAQALVEDIGQALTSGQLSEAEVTQLQNVMEGLTGDAEQAAEYIGINLHDGGALGTEIGATTQTYVDSENGVGDNGDRASITMKYKATSELLSESTCSNNDLYSYLNSIDSVAANVFFKSRNWPEGVQIPKRPEVLNPDGTINWDEAREGGYVLDSKGNAIKEQYTPFVGEVIDRFGPPNGRYVCPVKDGKPYSYNKRSLPFVEDATQYHQYKVIGDFRNIKHYIDNCIDSDVKAIVKDYLNVNNITDEQLAVYQGEIASAFNSSGGGIQYQFPLPINLLTGLGLLEKIY